MAPWPEPRRPWCVSLPARSRLCHMVGHGCPQLLQLLFPIEPDGSCCHLPLQWGHESQLLLPNPVGTTFFPSCGTAWGHRQGHSALRRRGHSSSLPVSCVGALPSAWRQRPPNVVLVARHPAVPRPLSFQTPEWPLSFCCHLLSSHPAAATGPRAGPPDSRLPGEPNLGGCCDTREGVPL